MNRRRFCWSAVLLTASAARAADAPALDFRSLVEQGRRHLEENLPDEWLDALPEADEEKIRALLRQLETGLAGEYVIDLAALRGTARSLAPLLEGFPEARPYAAWLRSRMDY
ncbi:MAG TPA: hypothetical protein PKE47_05985, partial [Verrucomicrobiota bacterium]|nr:hypothetical protein [Verrucomicrobiota bacterium]